MENNVVILRKNVKNFNLKVKPDLQVLLSVPIEAKDEQIEKFLKEKQSWIEEQLEYFRKYIKVEKKKEYVSGESYLYLGRQYRLKVSESDKEDCKLFQGYIYLYVKDKSNFKRKESLVNDFFKRKSFTKLTEMLNRTLELFNEEKDVTINIRKMTTMWGSCNKDKRNILLNSNLIKEKKSFIEYVIAHEVAHLKYADHSINFYNWLSIHMPDWEKRKNSF